MSHPPYLAQLRNVAFALSSTAPTSCVEAWAQWFNLQPVDAERRAIQGAKNAQGYSVGVVEAGIRRAIGAPAIGGFVLRAYGSANIILGCIKRDGPKFYGLRRVPGIKKVRKVLRLVIAERDAAMARATLEGPSLGAQPIAAAVPTCNPSSTQSTTAWTT